MENFQIPKYKVDVTLYLPNVKNISGQIYLSTISESHPGAERPSEIWKEQSFIAFENINQEFLILNNQHIMALSVDQKYQLGELQLSPEDLMGEFSSKQNLSVQLLDQQVFEGTLIYMQPFGAQRLIDCLNTNENSVILRADKTVHIINKAHILKVTPLKSTEE